MTGDGPGGVLERVLAQPDYASFRAALAASECRRCPLAAGRARIVVDRGDPRARLMLVGEAPGAEEDRQGIAFVGRGGRLLDDLLRGAGLDPARDVLIANVAKCRPPGNRPPAPEEARACLPYLRRQIALVAPRGLALLGATAVRWLLPDRARGPLRDLLGRTFADPAFAGTRLVALWHPAYLLRNPGRIPDARAHFALLPGLGD